MCPRSDKNVSTINAIILRQCETHSVIHIDAYRGFFSKRNQLRQHFFKPWDNVHLSRASTRRLLGIIHEQIEIVEDFAYCAYNDQPGDHIRGNSVLLGKYRELFTSTNEATLINLSKFVAIITEKFSV